MNKPFEPEDGGERPERRSRPHLRNIYEEARRHLDRIFRDRQPTDDSQADIEAHRIMHERYPHLGGDDIRVLVAAIRRVHQVLDDAGVANY